MWISLQWKCIFQEKPTYSERSHEMNTCITLHHRGDQNSSDPRIRSRVPPWASPSPEVKSTPSFSEILSSFSSQVYHLCAILKQHSTISSHFMNSFALPSYTQIVFLRLIYTVGLTHSSLYCWHSPGRLLLIKRFYAYQVPPCVFMVRGLTSVSTV